MFTHAHKYSGNPLFQIPWESSKCKGDLNYRSVFIRVNLHWKSAYQTRGYPYFRAWNRGVPLYLTDPLVCRIYQWKHHTAQQLMGNLGTRLSNGHTVATYWYVSTCTTNRYKYIAGSEETLGSAALVVRELERIEWMDVDAFWAASRQALW